MRTMRRKFIFPHSYTLISILIVPAAILTWVIPSGQFETVAENVVGMEKTTAVPGTCHQIDKVDYGQDFSSILMTSVEEIISAAEAVAFALIIDGALGIILKTGTVDRGLSTLARVLGNKGTLVIPIPMILLSLGGSTLGMSEEVVLLFMVLTSLMLSLGYDSMTAVLVLFLSTQAGYVGSTINPFSILTIQGVAGIYGNPLLRFRMLSWIVIAGIPIVFTILYASRVKRDPLSSIVCKSDLEIKYKFQNFDTEKGFSTQDKLTIAGLIVGLGITIWGIISKG